jgi:uncharacterized protein (UPF0335 family)
MMPAGEAVEAFDTSFDFSYYLNASDSKANLTARVLQPYLDEIQSKTGRKFVNPGHVWRGGRDLPLGGEADIYPSLAFNTPVDVDPRSQEERFDSAFDEIVTYIQETKDLYDSDSKIHQLTPMRLQSLLVEEAQNIRNAYLFNDERAFGWGDIGTDLAAGFTAAAVDPINMAAVFTPFALGPGLAQTVIQRLGTELVLALGSEVVIQSDIEKLYKEVGLEYTDEQFWTNVFAAGGGSLLLGGAIETLLASPKIVKGTKIKIVNYLDKRQQQKQGTQSTPLTLVVDGKIVNSQGTQSTRVEEILDAADTADTINKQTLDQNPLPDDPNDVKFQQHMMDAKKAIINEDFSELEFADQMKIIDELHHDKNNLAFTILNPEEIDFDAKLFQFKAGADEKGLLDTLMGVERWDDTFSGNVVVFEKADGTRIIADGHQRLGLAKRILADKNYKGPKPRLSAIVFKESDGFTPEFVRVQAGAKNLAEGSGSIVDAARLYKVAPAFLEKMLPPNSRLLKYGRGMAALHDDVLRAVDAGVVPGRYASFIGQYFTDKAEQLAVLDVLAKANPANLMEAESIVANVKMAGFQKADQAGLFSDDMIAASLFKERAKILSSTLGGMQSNKKLLNTLVEKSNIIEQYGNKLNKLNNAEKKDLYGQIIETIKHNANNAGPIADELTAVTERFGRGEIDLATATKQFEQAVRRRITSGDLRGIPVSQARVFNDNEAQTNSATKPGQQLNKEQLDKYNDDIFGNKLDEEIEALNNEVKDIYDDLDKSGYKDIKKEQIMEVENIDGTIVQKKSIDEMTEEMDFADAAIKEFKDC